LTTHVFRWWRIEMELPLVTGERLKTSEEFCSSTANGAMRKARRKYPDADFNTDTIEQVPTRRSPEIDQRFAMTVVEARRQM
jgi:hypothetical protein